MERQQHVALHHPHAEQCISIAHEHLLPLDYAGPDLCVCLHTHSNIVQLMRTPDDAIQKGSGDDSSGAGHGFGAASSGWPPAGRAPGTRRGFKSVSRHRQPEQINTQVNVRPVIYVERRHGVVFLLLIAVRAIAKEHELLVRACTHTARTHDTQHMTGQWLTSSVSACVGHVCV